jgi:MoxR-like ATPase
MEKVHQVHVSEVFLKHVIEIVHRTRKHPKIDLGCSPRAGIALAQGARARAFLQGRDYAIPEDLFALAEDAMLHRMRLHYEAIAEGRTGRDVLQDLLRSLGGSAESNGS